MSPVATIDAAPSLAGRTALVTGTGQSIGRGIAHRLAAHGAYVLCGDRDPIAAELVRDEILADGGFADAATIDVRTRDDLDRAVAEVIASHARLDVMCNADGSPGDGHRLVELPEKIFDEVFEANFIGVLHGCQAAGRVMTGAGMGSIINITSATLDLATTGTGAYAIATASIALLTKVMAREVGPDHVRVNSVAVNPIEGSPGSFDRPDDPDSPPDPLRLGVLGRGETADDVAEFVSFLASDASAYVTGQTVRLTGGRTMQW